MPRTYALIPAAGKSRRMGRPKLELPLGGRTVLEHAIDALRRAGISDILVVVGPDAGRLATLAAAAGAQVLRLEQDTPDMQATVLRGLDWLENAFHPDLVDSWLLLPADHPTLSASVIEQLLQARNLRPEAGIFIPTHDGRRGHPALIGWNLVPELRAWPAGRGLNVFLRQHAEQTCECPVAGPEVLLDLDTPDDYARLKEKWAES